MAAAIAIGACCLEHSALERARNGAMSLLQKLKLRHTQSAECQAASKSRALQDDGLAECVQ